MKNDYHTKARVIITRPAAQGERLAALVTGAGGHALQIPALEIGVAQFPEEARTLFSRINDFKYLVFISPNAVNHCLSYFDPATLNEQITVAIGASTAHAMELAGIRCDLCPEGNYSSETLLELPEFQEVAGHNVLIIRGNGGRALLGDELEKRGATVSYSEVYRRQIPATSKSLLNDALEHDAADIITANSVETLENTRHMTDNHLVEKLLRLTLVTGSPRVVQKANEIGFKHPALLATGPDDHAIMQTINLWSPAAQTANTRQDESTMTEQTPHADDSAATSPSDKPVDNTATSDQATQEALDTGKADEKPARTSSSAKKEVHADDTASAERQARIKSAPVKRSGAGIAWLALLIALLSALGAGWVWWQTQQDVNAPVAELNIPSAAEIISQVKSETDQSTNRISSKVDRQEQRLEQALDQQSEFASSLRTQKRSVETLTDQLQQTENSLSSMRGVSASVRNTWVRAETEYFLQTANTRLQLAGDIKSAKQALKAADERIVALGDPSLTPVRAQLSEDMLALESVPLLDIEGIALTLNSLANRINTLGLKNTTPDSFVTVNNSSEKKGAWNNAKKAVSGALTDIVRISPSDDSHPALLAPEQSYFLYRNLELQLQVARVAAMQGRQNIYDDSLNSSLQWLEKYFEPEDPGVIAINENLLKLQREKVSFPLPDISKSLNMLRAIAPGASYSGVVKGATTDEQTP